ncbi:MAG: CoA ester lyase [Marinilabiliales bacterium]|nr:MAG: CoA ester lyase [Marinilabiliales bacterium]
MKTKKKINRRSILYIPGNNPAMIQQGGVYGADGILLDLEDAVAPAQKDSARILVKNMIQLINFYDAEVIVRINHLSTPFGQTDLEQIVPLQPDALRLPKIESKQDVMDVLEVIEKIEKENKITDSKMKIHPMIETSVGVMNVFEIAGSSKRVDSISIGGQDLTADMGIIKTKDPTGLDYARKAVVMAAKANKIDAIDTVFADIEDMEGLREETIYAKMIGFSGKAVINPRQIEVIHDVYAPSEEEIRKAVRIIREFKKQKEKGVGVFAIDGKMIDAPIVARAQHVLDIANINIDELSSIKEN